MELRLADLGAVVSFRTTVQEGHGAVAASFHPAPTDRRRDGPARRFDVLDQIGRSDGGFHDGEPLRHDVSACHWYNADGVSTRPNWQQHRGRHDAGRTIDGERVGIAVFGESTMTTPIVRPGCRTRSVMRFASVLTLALVIALAPNAGWGEDHGDSRSNWFRVTWQPGVLPATIEGHVENTSPLRAIDVRLHIEGVDAANHRMGERLVWASDDIAPGGTTSYLAETIPGAVDYRVTVVSFELITRD